MSAGPHTPSRDSRGDSGPCLFQLLAAPVILWLVTASLYLCHHHHMVFFSFCICLPPCALVRTVVIRFRARLISSAKTLDPGHIHRFQGSGHGHMFLGDHPVAHHLYVPHHLSQTSLYIHLFESSCTATPKGAKVDIGAPTWEIREVRCNPGLSS